MSDAAFCKRSADARNMEKRTLRIPKELDDKIDEIADADGVSGSEAARKLLRRGVEADSIEAERDDLKRQLRAVNKKERENEELQRYVEEELSWREAGVFRRAKWWLTGRPR